MPENIMNAELASQVTLDKIKECLDNNRSFVLEAGAGAGKTYSLIRALHHVIDTRYLSMMAIGSKVACITYTNVAKDEIASRINNNPLVFTTTIHSFSWSLMSSFNSLLREHLLGISNWSDRVEEYGDIENHIVQYSDGIRYINENIISIHHDDVIPLMLALLDNDKFVKILKNKFPIILIDEYQDTDSRFFIKLKEKYLAGDNSVFIGLFGDSWQKIYPTGFGKVEDAQFEVIEKNANFRSKDTIVQLLNLIRPSLIQHPKEPGSLGSLLVLHTNNWVGERRSGGHWAGDLPVEECKTYLNLAIQRLGDEGWDFGSNQTKVLMLTHNLLAREQGYENLANVFRYNDSFVKKENKFIEYFADKLEPLIDKYLASEYGEMFSILKKKFPHLKNRSEKQEWREALDTLVDLCESGTIGQVIEFLTNNSKMQYPSKLRQTETRLIELQEEGGELSRSMQEYQNLKNVDYIEVRNLVKFLNKSSPFATKHGVKGEEYDNVLIVIGRGWNHYNFDQFLTWFGNQASIPTSRHSSYEKNRNLFYVSCSRAKKKLAILFTTKLTDSSLRTLENLFGAENIEDIVS